MTTAQTTQASTKVRLVRCPKCREVLPELPDVPMYRCGGCSTILLAKNRKVAANEAKPSPQETDSVANDPQSNALKAGGSSCDSARASSVESLTDKDNLSRGECKPPPELSNELEGDSPDSENIKKEPFQQDKQESGLYDSGSDDVSGEWTGASSGGFPSSGELARNVEPRIPELNKENHSMQHQDDDKVDDKSQRVWREDDDDFNDELRDLPDLEDVESVVPSDVDNGDANELNCISPENDKHIQHSRDGVEFDGIVSPENENVLQSVEAEDFHSRSDPNASAQYSVVRSRRSRTESLGSFYLTCNDDDDLDHHSVQGRTRNFDRISSMDTLGGSSPSPSPPLGAELNFKYRPTANYSRAGSYYDGSESSYDGADDLIRNRRQVKDENYIGSIQTRKGEFNANSEPERSYWESSSSHRDKTVNRNGYSSESGLRFGQIQKGGVSRLPPRDPGSRNVRPPRPFSSSEKLSYSEVEKIDLLKRVNELKDQLNRLHFPKVASRGRFPPPERESYADFYHHGAYNPRRYSDSRLAFSGEACTCLHCGPEQRRYSVQLPMHSTHCNAVDNDHSGASSPWHYTSSELSLWGEANPEIQRRMRSKERAKKHMRPVAGGAPVVVCYHCSELLQLPADFLLFKRKIHRLRCTACSEILKFSLVRGTHLVPCVPGSSAPAPPPSENGDYNDGTKNAEPEPMSRYGEAVSCSDYGKSLCRSCSTETGNSYRKPGSSFEQNEDRKMKYVMREDPRVPAKWRRGSSEIEEVDPLTNSPLHQLLGYSSISQVLKK